MAQQQNIPNPKPDEGPEQIEFLNQGQPDQQGADQDQIPQGQFGSQGVQQFYSNLGPHSEDTIEDHNAEIDAQGNVIDPNNPPNQYGLQDQFGDVDGQDPYSNLGYQDPAKTNAGIDPDPDTDLYGLEEPLAQPGDVSRKGSETDHWGTRRSQDQNGYQQ